MMDNEHTFVSVIVPVYNARDYLMYSLPAIRKSHYPNYELIIVDDNSTDGSFELIREYADIVINNTQKKQGPARMRNRGAQISKGSILFFVDADVLIKPDTISKIVNVFKENPELTAVFGSYDEEPKAKDFFSQYKNLFHHFIHQNANSEVTTFWAGCGALRRENFFAAGGFPEKYKSASIEDVELGYTLVSNGGKIRLLKDLEVTHLKKWSLISLLRADILQRAVPWTKLAFKKGLPSDLNFKLSDRISGITACLLSLGIILMWYWKWFTAVSIGLVGILIYLNKNLYSFFFRKRGMVFMVFAILFHWVYLLYSSVTFFVVYLISLLRLGRLGY